MPPIAVTLPPREQIEKDAASLRSSCVRASLLGHFCDVAALERLIIAARLAPDLNELPALVAAEFHSAYANEEATTIEDCVLTVLSRRAA